MMFSQAQVGSLTAELFRDSIARVSDNSEQHGRNDSRDREIDALLRARGRHLRMDLPHGRHVHQSIRE